MSMGEGVISYSLGGLRKLTDTFPPTGSGKKPGLKAQRRAVGIARELGATAVPLLQRKLQVGSEDEASWAYFLLAQLGGARVEQAARGLLDDAATPDDRKALALALLTELGAELPSEVALRDPDGLRASSVGDLIGRLAEPSDVARAVDLLVDQILPGELATFVTEMVQVAEGAMTPLVDELLARDDLEAETLSTLRDVRTRLPDAPPAAPGMGRVTVWLGRRPDGARVILATQVRPGEPQRRALQLRLSPVGLLEGGQHEHDLPARGGLRTRVAELRAEGFQVRRVRPRDAASAVARAACAARLAGRRLPRAYFLGRDLLGLTREHVEVAATLATADLLAEAERLYQLDQPEAAAHLALRHIEAFPEDADGRALYGSCLLALGRPEAALPHLAVAAHLAPDEPTHHWNHSHAAKACEKLGSCYLALRRYLLADDRSDGAGERAEIARRFLRTFERFARLEHPDASVENVARCEELFDRAFAHMNAGRHTEAQSGYEAVLKLVPSHYQSWSNLGVVLMAQKKREEAMRCLRKALSLRPDYEVARRNLAMMDSRL
jgi:tetratricopeptide (TPR) repeat protein